jgi:hypothetical protein
MAIQTRKYIASAPITSNSEERMNSRPDVYEFNGFP